MEEEKRITLNINVIPLEGNMKPYLIKNGNSKWRLEEAFNVIKKDFPQIKILTSKIYVNGKRLYDIYFPLREANLDYLNILIIETSESTYKTENVTISIKYVYPSGEEVERLIVKEHIYNYRILHNFLAELLVSLGVFKTPLSLIKKSKIYINGNIIHKSLLLSGIKKTAAFLNDDITEILVMDSLNNRILKKYKKIAGKKESFLQIVKKVTDFKRLEYELEGVYTYGTSTRFLTNILDKFKESEYLRETMRKVEIHLDNVDFDNIIERFLKKSRLTSLIISITYPRHSTLFILEKDISTPKKIHAIFFNISFDNLTRLKSYILEILPKHDVEVSFDIFHYQLFDTYSCNIGGGHCVYLARYLIIHYLFNFEKYFNKRFSFDEMLERLKSVASMTETGTQLVDSLKSSWPDLFYAVNNVDFYDNDLENIWEGMEQVYISLGHKEAVEIFLNVYKLAFEDMNKERKKILNFKSDVMFLDIMNDFKTGFDDVNLLGNRLLVILEDLASKEGIFEINNTIPHQLSRYICSYCKEFKGKNILKEQNQKYLFCNKKCQIKFYNFFY